MYCIQHQYSPPRRHIQSYAYNDSTRRASVDAAGFGIRRRFGAYYGRPNARLARDPSFKTVSALMDVQPPDSPRGLPHPAAGSRCRRAPGRDGTKRGGLFPGSGGGRGTMQKIYMHALAGIRPLIAATHQPLTAASSRTPQTCRKSGLAW
jgi:hypothetical protein